MDDRRFDNLTRSLARGTSRRSLLKGLAGAVLGSGAAIGGTRTGDAFICRQPGVLCAKDVQCCSQSCINFHCACPDGTNACGRQCCTAGQACQGGQCADLCTSTTCAAKGIACGSTSDGCGATLHCGDCPSATCSTGSCVQGQCMLTPIDGCCATNDQCDDGNACTVDACDTSTSTCTHTPLSCTASDTCHTASCDSSQGCIQSPVADDTDCGNGMSCQHGTCACPSGTIDCGGSCQQCCSPANCPGTTCSPATCDGGTCGRAPISGCCTQDSDCGDSNACTVDTCDPTTNTCQHAPSGCTPSDECHTASCDASQGCIQTAKTDGTDCGDGKTCQNGTCTSACTPKTCAADYPGQCGTFDDGCTGSLPCQCGECQQCGGGTCSPVSDGASCSGGTCQSGECIRTCTSFNDCIPNNPCLGGNCVNNGSGPKCQYEPINEGQSCGADLKICQSGRCCIPDGQPVAGSGDNCCSDSVANPNGVLVCGTLNTCIANSQSCVPGTYCCNGGLCGEQGTHAAGLCCIPDGQPADGTCCADIVSNPGTGAVCGPPPCVPDCTGQSCGNDGCGGSCGTCPTGCCNGLFCVAGTTTSLCGSGGATCTACASGETCQNGVCACPPGTCGPTCGQKLCPGFPPICIDADRCCTDADCVEPCRAGTCCTPQDARLGICKGGGVCRDFHSTCFASSPCETASCGTGTCVKTPTVTCTGCLACDTNPASATAGTCAFDNCRFNNPCQFCDGTTCRADQSLNYQSAPCNFHGGGFCFDGQCVGCLPTGADCTSDSECCTDACQPNPNGQIGSFICQCSPDAIGTCATNSNCCNNCCNAVGVCADFSEALDNCGACGVRVPAGGICDNGHPTCTLGFYNDNGRCCPVGSDCS